MLVLVRLVQRLRQSSSARAAMHCIARNASGGRVGMQFIVVSRSANACDKCTLKKRAWVVVEWA